MQDSWVQLLGWKDPLEKEVSTHSSILAWKIPWTEEPGGLQSMELYWMAKSQTRLSNNLKEIIKLIKSTFLFKSINNVSNKNLSPPGQMASSRAF